ncbi:MAG: hypothetical protein HXX17_09460, partial [Geobacteraceae bacterium]|nr:hypothetical protein [Geobacteraceae bacterium]
ATGSVAENAPTSTIVYTAAATDPDAGDSVSFSLTGADGALFNINSSSGEVTLKNHADFESRSSYSFNLVATDSGELTDTKEITINVTDVKEADQIYSVTPMSLESVSAPSEGATTPFEFVIHRTDMGGISSVGWSVGGLAAADFADGKLPSGTAEFADSTDSVTVTVNIPGNPTFAALQHLSLTLSDPSTGYQIDPDNAYATVDLVGTSLVSGSGVLFSVAAENSGHANEGALGTNTEIHYTITRSGDTSGELAINYHLTSSGAAIVSADDFGDGTAPDLPGGIVIFAAGSSSAEVVVTIHGDNSVGPDEQFNLLLGNLPDGSIVTGVTTGVIVNDDAYISVSSQAVNEELAGHPSHSFVLTRSSGTEFEHTVHYSIEPIGEQGANLSQLASPLSGDVTFLAGESSHVVTLDTVEQPDIAGIQSFAMTITGGDNVTVLNDTAVSTILPNQMDVEIGANIDRGLEGTAEGSAVTLEYTVTRSGSIDEAATLHWTVAGDGDNPASAEDFAGGSFPSGDITFAAGETVKTIHITPQPDAILEGDEGFVIHLTSNLQNVHVLTGDAAGTIVDDECAVGFESMEVYKDEGDSGSTVMQISVGRFGFSGQVTTVEWRMDHGDTDLADFTPGQDSLGDNGGYPSGIITLLPGESSGIASILIAGDTVLENDEAFTLSLANASAGTKIVGEDGINAPKLSGTVTGIIVNDDSHISIASEHAQISQIEGDGGNSGYMEITVERTGSTAGEDWVKWTLSGSGDHPADNIDIGQPNDAMAVFNSYENSWIDLADTNGTMSTSGTFELPASGYIMVAYNRDSSYQDASGENIPFDQFLLNQLSVSGGATISFLGMQANSDYLSNGTLHVDGSEQSLIAVHTVLTLNDFVAGINLDKDITDGLPANAFSYSMGNSTNYWGSNYSPDKAFDNNNSSLYLNYGTDADLIIDSGQSKVVTALGLTTNPWWNGNYNPSHFVLYGSNTGSNADMTEIASGNLDAPSVTSADYPDVTFENSTAYRYYHLVFDQRTGESDVNSNWYTYMSVSEVRLIEEPPPLPDNSEIASVTINNVNAGNLQINLDPQHNASGWMSFSDYAAEHGNDVAVSVIAAGGLRYNGASINLESSINYNNELSLDSAFTQSPEAGVVLPGAGNGGQRVVLSSEQSLGELYFTVSGLDANGNSIHEEIRGPSHGSVETAQYFSSVTEVSSRPAGMDIGTLSSDGWNDYNRGEIVSDTALPAESGALVTPGENYSTYVHLSDRTGAITFDDAHIAIKSEADLSSDSFVIHGGLSIGYIQNGNAVGYSGADLKENPPEWNTVTLQAPAHIHVEQVQANISILDEVFNAEDGPFPNAQVNHFMITGLDGEGNSVSEIIAVRDVIDVNFADETVNNALEINTFTAGANMLAEEIDPASAGRVLLSLVMASENLAETRFTITGTDSLGHAISETMYGPNGDNMGGYFDNSCIATSKSFATVTSIVADSDYSGDSLFVSVSRPVETTHEFSVVYGIAAVDANGNPVDGYMEGLGRVEFTVPETEVIQGPNAGIALSDSHFSYVDSIELVHDPINASISIGFDPASPNGNESVSNFLVDGHSSSSISGSVNNNAHDYGNIDGDTGNPTPYNGANLAYAIFKVDAPGATPETPVTVSFALDETGRHGIDIGHISYAPDGIWSSDIYDQNPQSQLIPALTTSAQNCHILTLNDFAGNGSMGLEQIQQIYIDDYWSDGSLQFNDGTAADPQWVNYWDSSVVNNNDYTITAQDLVDGKLRYIGSYMDMSSQVADSQGHWTEYFDAIAGEAHTLDLSVFSDYGNINTADIQHVEISDSWGNGILEYNEGTAANPDWISYWDSTPYYNSELSAADIAAGKLRYVGNEIDMEANVDYGWDSTWVNPSIDAPLPPPAVAQSTGSVALPGDGYIWVRYTNVDNSNDGADTAWINSLYVDGGATLQVVGQKAISDGVANMQTLLANDAHIDLNGSVVSHDLLQVETGGGKLIAIVTPQHGAMLTDETNLNITGKDTSGHSLHFNEMNWMTVDSTYTSADLPVTGMSAIAQLDGVDPASIEQIRYSENSDSYNSSLYSRNISFAVGDLHSLADNTLISVDNAWEFASANYYRNQFYPGAPTNDTDPSFTHALYSNGTLGSGSEPLLYDYGLEGEYRITFSSVDDLSGRSFTISGYDMNGNFHQETLAAGPDDGVVATQNLYSYGINVDANEGEATGALSIGYAVTFGAERSVGLYSDNAMPYSTVEITGLDGDGNLKTESLTGLESSLTIPLGSFAEVWNIHTVNPGAANVYFYQMEPPQQITSLYGTGDTSLKADFGTFDFNENGGGPGWFDTGWVDPAVWMFEASPELVGRTVQIYGYNNSIGNWEWGTFEVTHEGTVTFGSQYSYLQYLYISGGEGSGNLNLKEVKALPTDSEIMITASDDFVGTFTVYGLDVNGAETSQTIEVMAAGHAVILEGFSLVLSTSVATDGNVSNFNIQALPPVDFFRDITLTGTRDDDGYIDFATPQRIVINFEDSNSAENQEFRVTGLDSDGHEVVEIIKGIGQNAGAITEHYFSSLLSVEVGGATGSRAETISVGTIGEPVVPEQEISRFGGTVDLGAAVAEFDTASQLSFSSSEDLHG